jgi:nitrogen fixation protein NifU and related proteins
MSGDLYGEAILARYRGPRYYNAVENASLRGEGRNALCGDTVEISLRIEGDAVVETAFEGSACALCTASSDILCETLTGKSLSEARTCIEELLSVVKCGDKEHFSEELLQEAPKDIRVLREVRAHPSRIDCVTLPWQTALEMLNEEELGHGR